MSGGVSGRFIVYATSQALLQAERRGLGVLESLVEAAILAGRVNGRESGERRVFLDGDCVARTRTKDRTPSGRRRLLVTRLESNPQTRRTR